jgi:methylmalonyl-CoA mutase C-terminal domain/subunit
MVKKIRVLVAKPGLDGHDRGAKIVARALRDAGMEVVYTGLHQTAEQIVNTAMQEDVDVVGLSLLSGAHMTLFVDVAVSMKKKQMDDVLIIGGGIIPQEDVPGLKKAGIAEVFGPGTPVEEIVNYIKKNVKR